MSLAFVPLLGALSTVAQVEPPASAAPQITLKVVDFNLGEVERSMKCDSLTVSPDGKRVAYIVGKTGLIRGTVSVYVDEAVPPYGQRSAVSRGRSWPGVGIPVFSPDSQRVAHTAMAGPADVTMVVASKWEKHYRAIGEPVFSPDSDHVAYSASEKGGRWFIVKDGVEGQAFANVTSPRFSPDGQRIAHGATEGKQEFVVVNGARADDHSFDRVEAPVWSADGRHLAYKGKRGKRVLVVLDGVEGAPYDDIGLLGFTPDGRVAYAARLDGVPLTVIEGRAAQTHPEYKEVGTPVFSPDGLRSAYWAFDGKQERVVVDDVPGERYDHIGKLAFSQDGRHLAFEAGSIDRWSGGKWRLVVDGVETAEHNLMDVNHSVKRELRQSLRRGWVFERPDRLSFFGQRSMSVGQTLRGISLRKMTPPSLCTGIVRMEALIIEAPPER